MYHVHITEQVFEDMGNIQISVIKVWSFSTPFFYKFYAQSVKNLQKMIKNKQVTWSLRCAKLEYLKTKRGGEE